MTEREAVRAILAGDLRLARRFAAVAVEARRRLVARDEDKSARLARRQVIAAQASETYAGLSA